MNSPKSQEVIARFYEAIHLLKASGVIRGKQTFTRRYGIDYRNFCRNEREREKQTFQIEWLTNLVVDYGISAQWLLTGDGGMFKG